VDGDVDEPGDNERHQDDEEYARRSPGSRRQNEAFEARHDINDGLSEERSHDLAGWAD